MVNQNTGVVPPMQAARMMPDVPDTGGGGGVPRPPTTPPATTPPVTAPPVTTPATPSTPVPAPQQDFSPTAQNPLAPLNNYQPQQLSGSYQAPAFQGQSNYQPQSSQIGAASYSPQTSGQPYQAGSTQAQSVGFDPARAGQFDVNAFRPFADAVYSEATRQLDPQMQAREAQFRQQMVNQGIQEGSDAWNNAFANFSRDRNDAYSQARNQSLA